MTPEKEVGCGQVRRWSRRRKWTLPFRQSVWKPIVYILSYYILIVRRSSSLLKNISQEYLAIFGNRKYRNVLLYLASVTVPSSKNQVPFTSVSICHTRVLPFGSFKGTHRKKLEVQTAWFCSFACLMHQIMWKYTHGKKCVLKNLDFLQTSACIVEQTERYSVFLWYLLAETEGVWGKFTFLGVKMPNCCMMDSKNGPNIT